MALPPLGLYIHLPWCERKCPYCDFNSHEARSIPYQDYVDTLLEDLRRDLTATSGRSCQTIFIGGGTPSLFPPEAIAALLAGIASVIPLSPGLEITLEANPGSADAEKFRGFRAAGVNRLSIGIQSFNDESLALLGRIHDGAQAQAAIEQARAAGFDNINLDLMHGLPGQTVSSAMSDLEAAIACATPHLSWYQLTIERNTVFHNKPPVLPVEDTLADIQQAGEVLLRDAGLLQYEVSAYAGRGQVCGHNRNYWQFGDYLGIGAGAHGKLTFAGGAVRRTAKRRQPEAYMAAGENGFIADTRELGHDDLVGEFMLNALRLNEGFSLQLFEQRTGLPVAALEPQLSTLIGRELLQRDEDRISATPFGRRFLDDVIAEFL